MGFGSRKAFTLVRTLISSRYSLRRMVSAPIIQGRAVTPDVLGQVRGLIAEQPDWSRRRLALELCRQWQWHNAAGQIKDMAARSFLDKLEARGCIELPPRQRRRGPGFAPRLAAFCRQPPGGASESFSGASTAHQWLRAPAVQRVFGAVSLFALPQHGGGKPRLPSPRSSGS